MVPVCPALQVELLHLEEQLVLAAEKSGHRARSYAGCPLLRVPFACSLTRRILLALQNLSESKFPLFPTLQYLGVRRVELWEEGPSSREVQSGVI